jgi:membrane-associated phospholipid phosphatase
MVPESGLAEMLTRAAPRVLWPVDWVLLAYFIAVAAVVLWFWTRLPGAAWLLALHIGAILLVIVAIRHPGRASWVFRHWYPLPYVAWCYREMAILIPVIRGTELDAALARLDYRIWSANPTAWLERLSTPALTEYLQIIYTLFVPAVLLVPFLLWRQRRLEEFRYSAFLIALGYLVSYVGYVLVPARGPRFFLAHLQTTDLTGLWFTHVLQLTLDRLETKAWDCFPSGHVELTMLAWWLSRRISKRLFWMYFAYTLSIISATVYLRYHYTIDVLAGAVIAALLVQFAPHLYRTLEKGAA